MSPVERRQTGTTRTMIFGVRFLVQLYQPVHDAACRATSSPTGTPPGVGLGIKPVPVFLKPGDDMRLGIQGLGEQRQKVVASD
jgi:2-keto-4-pentenoate hydratase/2-oxohepta-3-ene-1,7-dioic acid hydratase in catechol pathway